jgi:hypothetical protein
MMQKCTYSEETGKANVAKWKKLHEQMNSDAKAMIQMGYAGKEGLALLSDWESRFLAVYNSYIKETSPKLLRQKELLMEYLTDEYDAIPKIWY